PSRTLHGSRSSHDHHPRPRGPDRADRRAGARPHPSRDLPRHPGALRRRLRRLQPHPLQRHRRRRGRAARCHRARHAHDGHRDHRPARRPPRPRRRARVHHPLHQPRSGACDGERDPRGRRRRRRHRRGAADRPGGPHRGGRRDQGARPGPRHPRPPGRRMRLSDLTTLRIGGEIEKLVEARSADEVIEAVAAADDAGEQLLVLGGGSNLVASDAPFRGTVVLLRDPEEPPLLDATCEVGASGEPDGIPVDPAELTPLDPTCGGAVVEYFAGVNWDRAVRYAIAREMVGIEALSGIPGSVGATPIQNVGAYGQDVSATISRVRTWDREKRAVRTFFAADCGFAYRDSVFKRTRYSGAVPSGTGRYVVLSVTFQHTIGSLSAPIRYAQLADALGVEVGQRAPMAEVREAVLRIRASKGMVLDPRDHDTWSAGSFFTNPILAAQEAAALPADAPRFDA